MNYLHRDTGFQPVETAQTQAGGAAGGMGFQPVEGAQTQTGGAAGGTGFQPVETMQTQARGLCPQNDTTMIPNWHRRGKFIPHRENVRFQTLTFRLFDSLPKNIIDNMRLELAFLRDHPNDAYKNSRLTELRKTIERYEDAGCGSCFLKDKRVAQIVADAMHYFNGERYRLIAYCIMPNHVHVIIDVNNGWSLSKIMHSWRSFTAKKANKVLGRNGQFWMEEYFDRYIRDDKHFSNALTYIRMNPVKAGLVSKYDEWPWTWEITQQNSEVTIENTEGPAGGTGFQPVETAQRQAGGAAGGTGFQPVGTMQTQARGLCPQDLPLARGAAGGTGFQPVETMQTQARGLCPQDLPLARGAAGGTGFQPVETMQTQARGLCPQHIT